METNFTFINGSDQKSSYFDNKTKSNLVVTIKDPNKLTDGYTKTVIKINSDNKHDYSKDYLTFVALEDGAFTFNGNIQYSIDNGNTWTQLAPNTNSPTIMAGNKILWKQNRLFVNDNNPVGFFTNSTARFNVKGNIMSLLYGDDFQDKIDLSEGNSIFMGLFGNNKNIISAENLILPATILAQSCYVSMFSNCTNLTIAPELPAKTLEPGCYTYMFEHCTNLSYIKCLATDTSASDCTTDWVNGVALTGIFVKNTSMNGWTTGNNGIPIGWTVQDA